MTTRTIDVAIFTTRTLFDVTSYQDVINLFNQTYPNNKLNIINYFVNTVPELDLALDGFIKAYPNDTKVIIGFYSWQVIECANYVSKNSLNILVLSPSANSNQIKTLTNTITYAPYIQSSVMSFFLTFVEYQMSEIKILYEPNSVSDSYLSSYLNEIIHQANLLNIKFSISFLEKGKENYNINSKSAIFILATSEGLISYVTPGFLNNIPTNSYIALGDINAFDVGDIFGTVPAFIINPTALFYSKTSMNVYNSLSKKDVVYFLVYALWDNLFVINYFTTNTLPINNNTYISVDPYQGINVPAWILNSYLDPKINGSLYGKYDLVFTKDSIIGSDKVLYNKYYKGGNVTLPQSKSIFRVAGISPQNESGFIYDYDCYTKIYNKCNLIVVRFKSDITAFPPEADGNFASIGQNNNVQFIYKYTSDGYFATLKRLLPCNGKVPQVNLTMSKVANKLKL